MLHGVERPTEVSSSRRSSQCFAYVRVLPSRQWSRRHCMVNANSGTAIADLAAVALRERIRRVGTWRVGANHHHLGVPCGSVVHQTMCQQSRSGRNPHSSLIAQEHWIDRVQPPRAFERARRCHGPARTALSSVSSQESSHLASSSPSIYPRDLQCTRALPIALCRSADSLVCVLCLRQQTRLMRCRCACSHAT